MTTSKSNAKGDSVESAALLAAIKQIMDSKKIDPDLDDYPRVRLMTREELGTMLRKTSRELSIHETRERKIKALLSANTPISKSHEI